MSFCSNCGMEIDLVSFCPGCGTTTAGKDLARANRTNERVVEVGALVTALAALVIGLGAFFPWAEASSGIFVFRSYSTRVDMVVVLIIAAGVLIHAMRIWVSDRWTWMSVQSLVAAAAIIAFEIGPVLRRIVEVSRSDEVVINDVSVEPSTGLYLLVIGAFLCIAAATVISARKSQDAPYWIVSIGIVVMISGGAISWFGVSGAIVTTANTTSGATRISSTTTLLSTTITTSTSTSSSKERTSNVPLRCIDAELRIPIDISGSAKNYILTSIKCAGNYASARVGSSEIPSLEHALAYFQWTGDGWMLLDLGTGIDRATDYGIPASIAQQLDSVR